MNVDWVRINSFITDEEGEQEWLRDMIQTLISDFEKRLIELDEISKDKNDSQLTAMLHQMKGISANFGLDAVLQIIIKAEVFSKSNDIESTLAEILKLAPVWQETKLELKLNLRI